MSRHPGRNDRYTRYAAAARYVASTQRVVALALWCNNEPSYNLVHYNSINSTDEMATFDGAAVRELSRKRALKG